ncbi:MAG: hypothetical protein IPM57_08810 [Oligoflexia bacterium]|nr:hypothetical protein [Oligoflexia bacterium]
MKNLDWIRGLVESERKMEETGIIDIATASNDSTDLTEKTYEFLRALKESFVDYTTAFNNMKNSTLGSVKIYGISNTATDFMLFRNGYKLLFSAINPGRIAMSFQNQSSSFLPQANLHQNTPSQEETLEAQVGPFGELTWTYRGSAINAENMVRYYMTRFIRESAK